MALAADPTAYSAYLEWRKRGTARAFRRLLRAASDTPALCRLCGAARALVRAQLDWVATPLNTTLKDDPAGPAELLEEAVF